jgi:hypothetical protein
MRFLQNSARQGSFRGYWLLNCASQVQAYLFRGRLRVLCCAIPLSDALLSVWLGRGLLDGWTMELAKADPKLCPRGTQWATTGGIKEPPKRCTKLHSPAYFCSFSSFSSSSSPSPLSLSIYFSTWCRFPLVQHIDQFYLKSPAQSQRNANHRLFCHTGIGSVDVGTIPSIR